MSASYTELLGIVGESIELEWNHIPGFTSLQILQKIQNGLQERNIEPEKFTDRIIFMSMWNGMDWIKRGIDEICISYFVSTVLLENTPASVANKCSSDSVVLANHTSRTTLASARPCLIPSRILPLGDTATRSSPLLGTVPRNNPQTPSSCCLHVVLVKQPSSVSHQPRPHVHGGCHFHRETCFQLEMQASNLTFHCVLCSPNRTDVLTAESWCCLILELSSICAGSHRDLVCQQLQRGFWIDLLRTAFAYAIRVTNAAHIAERYAFSSDFVDNAAHNGFWAALSTITRVVTQAWSPGWCLSFGVLEKIKENPSQTRELSHSPLVAANAVLHDPSP